MIDPAGIEKLVAGPWDHMRDDFKVRISPRYSLTFKFLSYRQTILKIRNSRRWHSNICIEYFDYYIPAGVYMTVDSNNIRVSYNFFNGLSG